MQYNYIILFKHAIKGIKSNVYTYVQWKIQTGNIALELNQQRENTRSKWFMCSNEQTLRFHFNQIPAIIKGYNLL